MSFPQAARYALFLTSLLLAGCTTLRPSQDYARARHEIERVVGRSADYDPVGEAAIAQRVHDLVSAGLSADAAVQVSLLNNRDLQAAWLDIGMARADLVQSGLISNPIFDLSLRFPAAGGLPDITAGLAAAIGDIWQIPIRKQIAQQQLTVAILTLADKAAGLAFDTRIAYFRVLGAEQVLEMAHQNEWIARQSLELAQIRQRAGAGSEVDVNLARGPVLDAQVAIRNAWISAGDARRALARLLGLAEDADQLVLRDALPALPDVALDSTALLSVARDARLDLRIADAGVAAAAAQLKQQIVAVIPALNAGVEMERSAVVQEPGRHVLADSARTSIANGRLTAPEIEPRSERRANHRQARNAVITGPTFSLPLPLFDWNQAQLARAHLALQQAEKSRAALEVSLAQDVRGAVEHASAAWELACSYGEESVPLAERNLDLTLEAFKAGKSSLLETLEAQRFLLEARTHYAEALQDAAAQMVELERTVGRPVYEWSPSSTRASD